MKKILLPILSALVLQSYAQSYHAGAVMPVYHNINPDTLLHYTVYPYTDQRYGLRLFGSDSDNVRFMADGSVSPGGTIAAISILSLDKNLYIRFGRWDSVYVPAYKYWDVTQVARPLSVGDIIDDPAGIWSDTLLYLTDHTGWGGGVKNVNDWIGAEDKYIGLKYQKETATAYGWIRLRCPSADSCYLKDYAYTTFSTGIDKTEIPVTLQIFPNPVKNDLYLQHQGSISISSVRITDVYGKSVRFDCEQKAGGIRIGLEHVPGGCYLLSCFVGGEQVTRKILKVSE